MTIEVHVIGQMHATGFCQAQRRFHLCRPLGAAGKTGTELYQSRPNPRHLAAAVLFFLFFFFALF